MYQRILIPTDGSTTSNTGLDEAIKLAKLTGAELRLVHVVDALSYATGFDLYGAHASDVIPMMREAGKKILEQAKAHVETQDVKADSILIDVPAARVAETIADQATKWHADLIVIGTHGRRGIKRLMLGSDAEQIVRIAPVPVLLVRAAETAVQPNTQA